jgi:hypothetical protein
VWSGLVTGVLIFGLPDGVTSLNFFGFTPIDWE